MISIPNTYIWPGCQELEQKNRGEASNHPPLFEVQNPDVFSCLLVEQHCIRPGVLRRLAVTVERSLFNFVNNNFERWIKVVIVINEGLWSEDEFIW